MERIWFPDEDALLAALRAGWIGAERAAEPAWAQREGEALWVGPAAPWTPDERAALAARGLALSPGPRPSGRPLCCWAEAVRARPAPLPPACPELVFALAAPALLPLAGELLRLGCAGQRWALAGDRAWIHALEPPWYSVLRIRDEGGSVYEPAGPGVWVQLGWAHPLAASLRPPAGHRLLIGADGPWELLADGPWTPLAEQLDLALPAPERVLPAVEPPRLRVRPRLVARGRPLAPTLWVLREDGPARLDALVARLPEALLDRLLFAVVPGADLALLRARPSPAGPPTLELAAEAYAPHLDLPHLHLPVDATLQPPLRRDRAREVFAPDPHQIGWLVREGDGLRVESLAERAFRPLGDWVDYLADRASDALIPWVEGASFAFDDWVGASAAEPQPPPARTPASPAAAAPRPAPVEPTVAPIPPPAPTQAPPRAAPADARELAAIEQRFLASDAPLDHPARVPAWRELAQAARQLGRDHEASLAWSHAVWAAPDPDRAALAQAWAADELATVGLDPQQAAQALAQAPSLPVLRAVAACLVAGRLPPQAELAAAFARADGDLDVRAVWLARLTLAGTDPLAVARARDAVLGRIRGGLSLARDLPAFLRRLDAQAVAEIGAHLRALRAHLRGTERVRHPIEADPRATAAYLDRALAWGHATLGDRGAVTELLAHPLAVDRAEPVHGALLSAYEARIAMALDGLPRERPLPPEVMARFEALGPLERYAANRLRQVSGILEAQERLIAFEVYDRGHQDSLGPGFAALRQLDDPERLAPALHALLGEPGDGRRVEGVLVFLPRLPAADALPLLDRAEAALVRAEPRARARALTGMLAVVGQLGRIERARQLSGRLHDALAELPLDQLAAEADGLVAGLRGLGRLGLGAEAGALLDGLIGRAAGEGDAARLTGVVAAGGLFGLGRTEQALPWVDAGLDAVGGVFRAPPARLRLVRTLGLALAAAPRALAHDRLPRLAAHLPSITDSYSTNAWFCLSVVDFAESLVLGYADGAHARGQGGGRWVDQAELGLRQGLHRSALIRTGG